MALDLSLIYYLTFQNRTLGEGGFVGKALAVQTCLPVFIPETYIKLEGDSSIYRVDLHINATAGMCPYTQQQQQQQ